MQVSQLEKMSPFGVPELVSTCVIEPVMASNPVLRVLRDEHELERTRVGQLQVGTRVAFRRPNEGRRSGVLMGVPTEFSYVVGVDDLQGDEHLAECMVAVLWASHEVEILGNRGEVLSRPPEVVEAPPPHRNQMYATEHMREWVACVDKHRRAGQMRSVAVRLANRDMRCRHHPSTYLKWSERLGEKCERRTSNIEHRTSNGEAPVARAQAKGTPA